VYQEDKHNMNTAHGKLVSVVAVVNQVVVALHSVLFACHAVSMEVTPPNSKMTQLIHVDLVAFIG